MMQGTINITDEIKRLKEELAVSNAANETLRLQLEKQTNEVNHFTYIVSHDLQAPLRMVTGFMELLEKRYNEKIDDAGKKYIGFAVKGATKMRELVFALLEYSRLNTVEKVIEPINLKKIIEEACIDLAGPVQLSGTKFITSDLPVIMADRKQMRLLFNHLLDNAIKFRGEAAPVIAIDSTNDGNYFTVTVSDNGPGIEAAYLEKIFIMFRRLHADEIKYPGTGAGLAVCKKIMEDHKGTINAVSDEGMGTTIVLRFPIDNQVLSDYK